jgi:protein TonB
MLASRPTFLAVLASVLLHAALLLGDVRARTPPRSDVDPAHTPVDYVVVEPEPEPPPPPPRPPPPQRRDPIRPRPAAQDAPPPDLPEPEPSAPASDAAPGSTPVAPEPAGPALVQAPPHVASPPPVAPRGLSQGELGAYARSVRARFVEHRRYPPAAMRLRLEGIAKVKLRIDRSGRLVGTPELVGSSGHAVLDDEALRVVRAAGPFAPFPPHCDKPELVFVIPIDFRLE